MRRRGDIWETQPSETQDFPAGTGNSFDWTRESSLSRTHHKPLIQLELYGCLVEAAGVEPVPAHFLTGDGERLPNIGLDPPRNLLPSPSPGVPCSPLESPQSWRHFG